MAIGMRIYCTLLQAQWLNYCNWIKQGLNMNAENGLKILNILIKKVVSFQKTVREVAGVGPKALNIATRAAFMKNPSKGRLLDEVFLLPPEMLAKSRYVLDDSPRRYVRTPSFKTNGLVLSLLWIDTTSKPPPPDRKVEDTINLPYIFHNKTLRSTHKDAWIIALAPGATCIVGAVANDPNHPDQRRNLAVTTKCLAEPERRYRNWLEADKPDAIAQPNGGASSPTRRLGPSSSDALLPLMTLRVRTMAPGSTRGNGGMPTKLKGAS
ncbi:hypothetical protein SeLEV6574_g07806 [Synchytrium endobioticum]|uniref:Uncharacterized protein n=1 Tax=Synchytrium endobioticum TaxID=286115 RepID=A0A507CJD5_9FUNG|nr:hypothetical protein SeLEV6574_g07806 [Synchytrium endobioticum]